MLTETPALERWSSFSEFGQLGRSASWPQLPPPMGQCQSQPNSGTVAAAPATSHQHPDVVPDVTFVTRVRIPNPTTPEEQANPFRWEPRTSNSLFKGKRIVLFALPGAFTPTCSSTHLPGYEELYDEIIAQGVDQIICLSVNDAFVMFQWAQAQNIKKIFMLPDGNGDFSRQMGMLVKKQNIGFGARSWRYSMLVEDCHIKKMFVEEGLGDESTSDPFVVSGAPTMLNYLKEINKA